MRMRRQEAAGEATEARGLGAPHSSTAEDRGGEGRRGQEMC